MGGGGRVSNRNERTDGRPGAEGMASGDVSKDKEAANPQDQTPVRRWAVGSWALGRRTSSTG